MSNELVLVTGAAGGPQGKTGRHLTELLLARGVPVRAFVHQIDERSDRLSALGAEVVEGDFLDFHSVERAVRGVSIRLFRLSCPGRAARRDRDHGWRCAEGRHHPPHRYGDADIVSGRADTSHAAELPV